MVWGGNVVLGPKLFQEGSEGFVNEVGSSIAYHHSWCSKARKDYFMKHLSCMLGVSCSAWHYFNPLGYVINGNKDVLIVLGLLEWSHEVNAPHIKYFYLKVVVEGHCIASSDVSL